MKKLSLVISVFFFIGIFAQNADPKMTTGIKEASKRDTVILSTPNIIQIKSISNNGDNEFDWSKNMPWIGAIIIGLTTIAANVIISTQLRKSNIAVTKQQIENSRAISSEQIEVVKKNSERDFKKTVLSSTRQLWINDFRTIVSELLSITAIFSFKQKMEDENNYKFNLFITKAELMLSNSSSHLVLKNLLEQLKNFCIQMMMENKSFDELDEIVNKIKDQTIIILNEEWEKASRAE